MAEITDLLKEQNILYAEDEAVLLKSVEGTLKFFFNDVFIASNGKEAFDIYLKEDLDIIILDINMPIINGIELAKKIRKIDKDIPIIFLTAHSEKEYLFEAIKIKVEDFLIKPFNLQKMINLFDKIYNSKTISKDVYRFKNGAIFNQKEKTIINTENKKIKLGIKEEKFLSLLVEAKQEIVPKYLINEEVWNYEMTETSYRGLLRNLRQKIGHDSIKTISGIGAKVNLDEDS